VAIALYANKDSNQRLKSSQLHAIAAFIADIGINGVKPTLAKNAQNMANLMKVLSIILQK